MTMLLDAPDEPEADVPGSPSPLVRLVVLSVVLAMLTLAGAYWATHRRPVYWSQVTVLFLLPPSAYTPNTLVAGSDSVITTAGIVGRMVGDSGQSAGVVSDSVNLPSEGIRHGWSIRLPDSGGQWATNFSDPALIVQAVAADPDAVTAMMQDIEARIQAALTQLQDENGVAAENRISATPNPDRAPVYAVGGSRTRALAATLLLGGALSCAIVAACARWWGYSPRSRDAR